MELEPQVTMKKESSVEASKEIGAITITGIEETKIGSAYPKQAVVVADNGATWEIPVVWIDENGNICNEATKYTKAYPVFAFYVPSEYKLKGDINGGIKEYVNKIYHGNKILFIEDPSTRVVYFTGANGAGKNISAEQVEDIAEITEETTESGNNNSGENNGSVENKAIDLVAMHCDKNAIEKMGYEKLAALIELIRYVVQPQAVDLLIESFP